MSVIGSFASKTFKVSRNHIYTFDDLTLNGELNIDEQEADGSKPSTYVKGPGLDKASFSIFLVRQKYLDVRKEIDDWRKIRDWKTPYYLIIGNSSLSKYKFLLTGVDASEIKMDSKGEFLSAKLQLSFSEYVRTGKKDDKLDTNNSKNNKTKSVSSVSKSSKKSKKRVNKNATKAKSSSNSSKDSNSKLEALEKELYG